MRRHPGTGQAILRLTLLCGVPVLAAGCLHFGKETAEPASAAIQRDATYPRSQVLAVQEALKQLGYDVGTADGVLGPNTLAAILKYQTDEKIPADGKLTAALIKRLGVARATQAAETSSPYQAGETFTYSDGSAERVLNVGNTVNLSVDGGVRATPVNFLVDARDGERTDAPPDFLQPLKVGEKGQYRIFAASADGSEAIKATVSCSVERSAITIVAAGKFETIEVGCRETDGERLIQERRWFYSPALRQVVSDTIAAEGRTPESRELVAIQPATETWPAAARAGFEWAIVNSLDSSETKPVGWSSTGVQARFEIDADAATVTYKPPGAEARTGCKRFTLRRLDSKGHGRSYPGLACPSEGKWLIPSRQSYMFAVPPKGLTARIAAPPLAPKD